MKKELYEKAKTVTPMVDVIDQYLADIRNALTDAKNQAENGSELGMATAVGAADNILDHLMAAWDVVKS